MVTGMTKTHAPANLTRYTDAVNSGNIARVLMVKAACGARATARAQVNFTTDPARVDCLRCAAKAVSK